MHVYAECCVIAEDKLLASHHIPDPHLAAAALAHVYTGSHADDDLLQKAEKEV